jgi:hypothetical protein
MTYSEGIEDGMKIAVNKINEELGTDFASLGMVLAHLWKVKMGKANLSNTTKFKETFCSQCGEGFGPGDSGYSSCKSHSEKVALHRYSSVVL